ncbi:uncharacterized protein LOC144149999 isoform X3 [Haemaphysalis longicornis]
MDREPAGVFFPNPRGVCAEGSPSPSSDSQRRARKRPWDDSDENLPSLESSETSSHLPTQPDSPLAGSDVESATSSRVLSLLEEFYKTLEKDDCTDYEISDEDPTSAGSGTESKSSVNISLASDSEGPTEDSTPWKSRDNEEGDAGPIALSTMESLNGQCTGQTLHFRLPCTATEDAPCQIVDHLSAWNEFFCPASWQLQELPGTSTKLSLAFFREANWRYCSSQERHLATLLACELLRSHRCVSHVELDIYVFKPHLHILSDALRASPLITSVKLACGWTSGEDLATAALSLPHLQELDYSSYAEHSPTMVARLSTFLLTTTSLTALKLSKGCPKGLSCEDFFQGLGKNCSLKELALPSRLIAEAPPRAQAAFTEWLTNSVSLKSLTLTSLGREYLPLECIVEAILANTSVVTLVLDCPEIDQSDVELVSKIFEQNKVLRCFKILYQLDSFSTTPSFVQGCPEKADGDRCLKALIENHTLEEVRLPFDIWNDGQWKELFEALPTKRNLRRVSIQAMGRAPPFLVGKLCAALKETCMDEKVCFSRSVNWEHFNEWCACKAFSSLFGSANDDNREAVVGILEHVPSLGHITCLDLYLDILDLPDELLSSVFATFLGATHSLKTLKLRFSWDMLLFDCQEGLMDGLAHNTSLREVRIEVEEARNDFFVFSERLADIVIGSRNVSRVYLDTPCCGGCAFLQSLSTGIADNYTVFSVAVPDCICSEFKRHWFKVWDTTRRNCNLLTDAADFARGARRDRHCALALDRMHSHPELVEEVARLEEVDEAGTGGCHGPGGTAVHGGTARLHASRQSRAGTSLLPCARRWQHTTRCPERGLLESSKALPEPA